MMKLGDEHCAQGGYLNEENHVTAAPRTLPILDFKRFSVGHPERLQALSELRDVSRDLGFFYLSGHDIPQQQIDALVSLARPPH